MKSDQLDLSRYLKHWEGLMDIYIGSIEGEPEESWPLKQFPQRMDSRSRDACFVALGFYCIRHDLVSAAVWGSRALQYSLRNFFGEWRNLIPDNPRFPDEAAYFRRGGGNWMASYRLSLAFAVALGNWDGARKLSSHPDEQKRDANEWFKSEGLWYLLLAEYLARGETDVYRRRLAAVRASAYKGARCYAECLDTIVRQAHGHLPGTFTFAMQYYLKTQSKRMDLEYKLAIDNTTLYHLARHKGIHFEVPDEWKQYLIVFPEDLVLSNPETLK